MTVSLPGSSHKFELLEKGTSITIETNSNYYNRLLKLDGIGELKLEATNQGSLEKLKSIGKKVKKLNKQLKGASIFEGSAPHQIEMSISENSISYKNPYHNKALILLKKLVSESKATLINGLKFKDPFVEEYKNKKMIKKDYLNKKKKCVGSENSGTCEFKNYLILLNK